MAFKPHHSFWEVKQYFKFNDLIIVGSGIVGLTTAIFYKKQHPTARVLVVEKGMLPSGASTKNAGFACFGSLSELLADQQTHSKEEVYALMQQRIEGLRTIRSLVGDEHLAFEPCGGYELFTMDDPFVLEKCLALMPSINQEIEARTGLKNTYVSAKEALQRFDFSGITHALFNQHEGAIDPAKMMHALFKLATSLNIQILNGLEVAQFVDTGSGAEIKTTNGEVLKCRHVHFATNGFATKLLPHIDVKPARAQVVITEPIANLHITGTFHLKEGFYYFRNVGNRILLGGGRELDIAGETTTNLATTPGIQQRLEALLQSVILPSYEFKIAHRWAGVMGVGMVKKAIVKRISNHVSCAVRLGGMGVAIGSDIGKRSAQLIG